MAAMLLAVGCPEPVDDVDAGRANDAGRTGRDAGRMDAAASVDSGTRPDAGVDDDAGPADSGQPACGPGVCPPMADLSRDVLSTDLTLNLTTRAAMAVITVAPSMSEGLSFEAAGLTVSGVTLGGTSLMHRTVDGQLDIGVPASSTDLTVTIEYAFADQTMFDGWMPANGVSFLWPHFCGNLYPCHSSPDDGSTFTMNVTGAPAGAMVVYPTRIPADAPTYMPAVAVGNYTYSMIGTTAAGTEVGVYYLPPSRTNALAGTRNLDAYVEFLETTYGAYSFGTRVASVEAPWGPGAYGGMEHHPFFHVGTPAMGDRYIHAHEAAHGWFGNGVRIACWEDFVLSEGLATYLGARAVEAEEGASAGTDLWADFQMQLTQAVARGDTIALPDATCNAIDITMHPLWSNIPYMKGAFFIRAVETQVGRPALDAALRSFYLANVGDAARMVDLLTHIQTETGFDPTTLASQWLRSMGIPR